MPSAKHVALVVEDDPGTADALKKLVSSLGHTCVHASTLMEARVLVANGGYCYALLDMEIPADPTTAPLVVHGESVLRSLRKRYPQRNVGWGYQLPIFVVTASSIEPDFISRMFELGADSFIAKPFASKVADLHKKIIESLEKTGREEHSACAPRGGVTDEEFAHVSDDAKGTVRIVVDGEKFGRRTGLLVNGARCELQDALFVAFLRFVVAHLREPGTWSTSTALGMTRNRWIPSRIRGAFASLVPAGFQVIEGDRNERYRLNPAIVIERVAWPALEQHPEPAVQKMAKEELEKRG